MNTTILHENFKLYRESLIPTLCIEKNSKLVNDFSIYAGLNIGEEFENRKDAARNLISRVLDSIFDKEIIAFAASYTDDEIKEYKKDIINSFNKLAIDNESLDKEMNSILKDANLACEREIRIENIKRELVFNSDRKYDKGGVLNALNTDNLKDSLKNSMEAYNNNILSSIYDEDNKNKVNDLGKEVINVINKEFDNDVDKALDKIENYLSFTKNNIHEDSYDLEKASRKRGKHFSKEDYEEMLKEEASLNNEVTNNVEIAKEDIKEEIKEDFEEDTFDVKEETSNYSRKNKKKKGFFESLILSVANKFSKKKDTEEEIDKLVNKEQEITTFVDENKNEEKETKVSNENENLAEVFDNSSDKKTNDEPKYTLVKDNKKKKTDKKINFSGKAIVATAAIVLGALALNSCANGAVTDKIKKIIPTKDKNTSIEQSSENATVIYEKRAKEVAKSIYSEYSEVLDANGYTDVYVEDVVCKLNGLNTITNISIKEVDDFMNIILNDATVNTFNTKEPSKKDITISQMLVKNQNGEYFIESVENDLNTMIKDPKNVDVAAKNFYKTVYRAYNDELAGINIGSDEKKNTEVDYMFVKISEFANLFASENPNLEFDVDGVKHSSYDYSSFDLYDGTINKYLKENGYNPKSLIKTK